MFYAFIFSKSQGFDCFYVIWTVLTALSWAMFYDECLCSFYHTQFFIDPDYKIGEGSEKYDFLLLISIFGKTQTYFVLKTLLFVYMYSLYTVFKRNNFVEPYIWINVLIGFSLYLITSIFNITVYDWVRILLIIVYCTFLVKIKC